VATPAIRANPAITAIAHVGAHRAAANEISTHYKGFAAAC